MDGRLAARLAGRALSSGRVVTVGRPHVTLAWTEHSLSDGVSLGIWAGFGGRCCLAPRRTCWCVLLCSCGLPCGPGGGLWGGAGPDAGGRLAAALAGRPWACVRVGKSMAAPRGHLTRTAPLSRRRWLLHAAEAECGAWFLTSLSVLGVLGCQAQAGRDMLAIVGLVWPPSPTRQFFPPSACILLGQVLHGVRKRLPYWRIQGTSREAFGHIPGSGCHVHGTL